MACSRKTEAAAAAYRDVSLVLKREQTDERNDVCACRTTSLWGIPMLGIISPSHGFRDGGSFDKYSARVAWTKPMAVINFILGATRQATSVPKEWNRTIENKVID